MQHHRLLLLLLLLPSADGTDGNYRSQFGTKFFISSTTNVRLPLSSIVPSLGPSLTLSSTTILYKVFYQVLFPV
jgi:hypothetical protein